MKHQPDTPAQAVVVNANYELFAMLMALLAFVNSILLVLAAGAPEHQIVLDVTTGLWVFLALDFVVRMVRNRFRYFNDIAHWLMLLGSLPVPFISVARLIGLGVWGRKLRKSEYRWMGRIIVQRRAQSTLLLIIFATIIVFEAGGILVLRAEAGDPAANIKTAGDALWWGYVTVATVGYGDRYPVTHQGRMVGILVMTFGVALFSSLTGFLSEWFHRPRSAAGSGAGDALGRDGAPPDGQALADSVAQDPAAPDQRATIEIIRQAIEAQERAHQAAMAELAAKLDAIQQQLHPGLAALQLPGVVGREYQGGPDLTLLQGGDSIPAVVRTQRDAEGAAGGEMRSQFFSGRIAGFLDNGDRRFVQVQTQGVAKQEQQHDRHEQHQRQTAGIAQQVPDFLAGDSADMLHVHGSFSSSTATNTSSSSGAAGRRAATVRPCSMAIA